MKTECRAGFELKGLRASCVDVPQRCMSCIHQLLSLTSVYGKMLVVAPVCPASTVFSIAVSTFDNAKFSHGSEI